MKERKVVWYSCGVSSFIAGLLTSNLKEAEWIRIMLPDEEADSERFLKDCEEYVGINIKTIQDKDKRSVNDIIRKKRFLNSPHGGPCTGPLKRQVRIEWEKDNINLDEEIVTYVWGFDKEEQHRADRMVEAFPEFKHEFPLIDAGLTKADCHGILKELGIKRPRMYDLGFPNNNCIMCLKAGMGTMNFTRKNFPEAFEERAKLEREIGHSCLRKYFLDELPEDAGRLPKPIPQDLTEVGSVALNKIKYNLTGELRPILQNIVDYSNVEYRQMDIFDFVS